MMIDNPFLYGGSNDVYPSIKDPKFEDKLYSLLEYNFLYTKYPYFTYRKTFKQEQLQFKKHQIFVHHFLHPQTPYNRLLLLHATGTGKTLSAYNIARGFAEQWKQLSPSRQIYSIFVVAFTKENIKNEFIRYPALGFVSEQDLEKLEEIKQIRGVESPEYKNERYKFLNRLSDPEYGGFFKFFGYQELTNKIFKYKKLELEKEILTYDKLLDEISKKNIDVDEDFVQSFNHGLLICDEIHNVYNTIMLNNYGSTIMYLLFHTNHLKALYLSATPLNNNPREIIDLVNIMSENQNELLSPSIYKELSSDIGKLEKVVKSSLRGKVSLYEDIIPAEYPQRIITGEYIKGIPMLLFTRCYMSRHYFNTYMKVINVSKEGEMTLDNTLSIYEDIIFPEAIVEERELIIKDSKWKEKYQLFVRDDGIFYGDLFYQNNLKTYSPKYYEMIRELRNTYGKVFIYHKLKKKNGVYMIETILKNNGYIFFNEQPNNFTRCVLCSRLLSEHKGVNHDFKPAKFISITGDLDVNQRREYKNYFNSVSNLYGHDIKIMIGSPVMEEGIELFAVNDVFVMTLPINISKFIQIVGRCVRKNSHIGLPEDKQHVNIRTFIHSMTENQKLQFKDYHNMKTSQILSIEEYHYKKKIEDHQEIQIIERFIKEIAIDTPLYSNITFEDELIAKPVSKIPINIPKKPDFYTFYLYGFVNDVIGFIIFFCKELFIRYKILSQKQIVQYFESNDFQVEFNTRLINQNLILYVLNKMVVHSNVINTLTKSEIYTIPGKKIVRIKNYYILTEQGETVLSDILTKEQRKTEISLLPYIKDIKIIIMQNFKKLLPTIKVDVDFLKIFDTKWSSGIPISYIIDDIIKSDNPIIKKYIKMFTELRKNAFQIIGIIDESGNFKLKDSNNVYGIACTSVKKDIVKKYFNLFPKYKLLPKDKSKELCNRLKEVLFLNHISQNHTDYLIINSLLKKNRPS